MITSLWNVDENGRSVVAVGKVSGDDNINWAIYLDGRIVVWVGDE